MKHVSILLCKALAVLALASLPAHASVRVALVIGNSLYPSQGQHLSAAADAQAVAKMLEGLGFQVILGTDLGIEKMYEKVVELEREAFNTDTALVYYAGHALQYGSANYLFPTDARVQDTLDVELRSINLELVLGAAAGAKNVVVLLDNRRDNPFLKNLRELGRAGRGGLADPAAYVKTLKQGALVMQAVSDEPPEGQRSALAAALLRHAPTAGFEVRQVMDEVMRALKDAGQSVRRYAEPQVPIYLAGNTLEPTGDASAEIAALQKKAQAGEPEAQSDLARRYEYGDGLTASEVQAAYWYRKAAEQGYAAAQLKLGSLYRNGKGVEADDAQALAWFRKAADQGSASGQYLVGVMHQGGNGTAQDVRAALSWYQKAAAQGFKPAKAAIDRLRAAGVK